ncbi:hypothetical protein AAFF_G00060130 [Aldrovandia affinis]|uniref:Uncharacterized protein n=1 Tax=Aldrovandia affinis TaxID=143900 RepID=A0AAD7WED7_9TELE|nr:hypothetical protein AAFF_G00060130 [Aldrovandia affinis]
MASVIFILLLFLDCRLSSGQGGVDVSGVFSLQFRFDPYYNMYTKSCCKFERAECWGVVNNRGYATDLYKGRISATQYSGLMVVEIWNLQKEDAGIYRCAVLDTPNHVYTDFIVKISDSVHQNPPLPPPKPTRKPTTSKPISPLTAVTPSATPVEILNEYHDTDISRIKGDMWITLAAVLGVSMFILITSVITIVVCLRKRKKSKSGSASCDRSGSVHTASISHDQNSIVYTTVDFKPRQEPTELYANLKVHSSPPKKSPEPSGHLESGDTVEYSTLSVRLQ